MMASKSHKGRWAGMDAGKDQSDDQVCLHDGCTSICISYHYPFQGRP